MIALPSYWADVPGQLKTFFDRNTPYGDTNDNRILKASKHIKGIETVKRISICETDTLNDLLEKHQTEIREILEFGKKIVSDETLA